MVHVRRRLLPGIDMVHFYHQGGAFHAGVSHTKSLEPAAHPHPAVSTKPHVDLQGDHPPEWTTLPWQVAWIDAFIPILDLLAGWAAGWAALKSGRPRTWATAGASVLPRPARPAAVFVCEVDSHET